VLREAARAMDDLTIRPIRRSEGVRDGRLKLLGPLGHPDRSTIRWSIALILTSM